MRGRPFTTPSGPGCSTPHNTQCEGIIYTNINFKTKKALKEAVAAGKEITVFSPCMGTPKMNGVEFVEGPHYPEPHSWYAEVTMVNGRIVKVK